MPEEIWDCSGYPLEYTKTFTEPDEVAVRTYIEYLKTYYLKEIEVDSIILQTESNQALVHRLHQSGNDISLTQINWASPNSTPVDYLKSGYARTFHRFYGPLSAQSTRARLLSHELTVPVHTIGTSDDLYEALGKRLKFDPSVVEEPPPPITYNLETIASAFAGALLRENRLKGKPMEIPSLGIAFFKLVS